MEDLKFGDYLLIGMLIPNNKDLPYTNQERDYVKCKIEKYFNYNTLPLESQKVILKPENTTYEKLEVEVSDLKCWLNSGVVTKCLPPTENFNYYLNLEENKIESTILSSKDWDNCEKLGESSHGLLFQVWDDNFPDNKYVFIRKLK